MPPISFFNLELWGNYKEAASCSPSCSLTKHVRGLELFLDDVMDADVQLKRERVQTWCMNGEKMEGEERGTGCEQKKERRAREENRVECGR